MQRPLTRLLHSNRGMIRTGRSLTTTGFAAKPVAARLERVAVHQRGASERIDYFHAAKNMLREALSDFSGGVQASFTEIGFDDGMAEKFTKAMLRQTKNALLLGVGFSVKLMTATVSNTSEADGHGAKPTFNIMARSIEISTNHSDGAIGVTTGNVSIESQFAGGPGVRQPHLLDISDAGGQPTNNLTTALQALQDPHSLLTNIDEDGAEDSAVHLDILPLSERPEETEKTLPQIDTPRVLSHPHFNSRILLSEMNHFRNDRNELITYIRLDALIPLTGKPVASTPTVAVSAPQPARPVFV